ncbi:DNA-binding response regulator, OmpR family, contains REC and winged-helix (wHTH) domain [Plantibacter sp. VKM Ac-1784]|uniref:DNA-binding response regulator, OmpR family, contains REC and winged-helix (WHTH) domain n=1 Tax=Plantibacter elymi (nom. nud.) TaxID=199708 RepID=A0ABY1RIF1_9MICO|nr:response regulator transcription factor [Plantibacter sp. VKM Ac-1784]SMQ75188.1 DNA-binding response regulator, OmpR family, contains REC and winged-helix (wHTH) domain [Plantibacter sp. VKM Ac-1784]
MRILVVDDEREMAGLLSRGLGSDGHDVTTAFDGPTALDLARQAIASASGGDAGFQVAVVDVMLPGLSGFAVCRELKGLDPTLAVILLTARDAVDDRVRGLDAGADDYMIKPFAFAELAARIRAVRRRDALTVQPRLDVGGLTLDLHRHRARVGDHDVPLSGTEFDVLRVLATEPGVVVSRAAMLREVWETFDNIDPNVVDQYISRLRRKLDLAEAGVRIVTSRGVGFSLVAAGG